MFAAAPDVRFLQAELAVVLRDYLRDPGVSGTALLRHAAELQVELRQLFERDGKTDWAGMSGAYRRTMSEVYGLAGVSLSERKKIGDAVRYHIMNVLREKLGPEELADLDLRAENGPERAKLNRDGTRAVLKDARKNVGFRDRPPAVARALAAALALIKADSIRSLSEAERTDLIRDLEAIQRQVARILRIAKKSTSPKPRKSR